VGQPGGRWDRSTPWRRARPFGPTADGATDADRHRLGRSARKRGGVDKVETADRPAWIGPDLDGGAGAGTGGRQPRRRHRGHRGEQRLGVLPEQAERAGGGHRPGASERGGRGLERQHRHGGVQPRRRHRPARSPGVWADRASTSRSTAATRGRSRPTRAFPHGAASAWQARPATRAPRTRQVPSGPCPGTSRTTWSPTATRRSRLDRGQTPPATSPGPTARGCTTRTWCRTSPAKRRSKATRGSPSPGPTTWPPPRRA